MSPLKVQSAQKSIFINYLKKCFFLYNTIRLLRTYLLQYFLKIESIDLTYSYFKPNNCAITQWFRKQQQSVNSLTHSVASSVRVWYTFNYFIVCIVYVCECVALMCVCLCISVSFSVYTHSDIWCCLSNRRKIYTHIPIGYIYRYTSMCVYKHMCLSLCEHTLCYYTFDLSKYLNIPFIIMILWFVCCEISFE